MLWSCHFCNYSTTNISMGHLGENTSKWCWKTTSGCHPNITKRLYFFSLIWIPIPVAYLDFGKIEPAERLLVHTKHNSIQHTLNGKHLQIRIQNIRSRTTSWRRGTLSRNAHFAISTSFAGSRDRNPPPMLPGSIPDSMQCVAWVCLGSERIYFFHLVLHFASQAKNQPDLFRYLFYVIFSLVHQQSTCIRQDYVATQIDIDDACYNLTFVIIWSRLPHNCKTSHFTSQKERERLQNVKNEKCTCKACKTIVFHYQICKFVAVVVVVAWRLLFKCMYCMWCCTNLISCHFISFLLWCGHVSPFSFGCDTVFS